MNRIGFRGFTKPSEVSEELVARKLDNMNHQNVYVLWSGNNYRARRASARSNALRTITEVKTPVRLSELVQRAAKAHEGLGYAPDTVRTGLFLHQGAKPAVYLALQKREDGAYVAATNIPFPDPAIAGDIRSYKAGDIVIPAEVASEGVTVKALAAPKKGKK